MRFILLSLLLLSTACANKNENITSPKLNDDFTQKVIYGEDDRLDLYEVEDQILLSLADSTLGVISNSSLTDMGSFYKITEESPGFCSSEPYSDQLTGPWCSGFLVGPDLVVTAGHCVRSSRCSSVSFIFGYAKKESALDDTSIIEKSEVYKCQEVIGREQAFNGGDWAVVRLDREVTNHTPLRLRREGVINLETNLTVIGHPVGLPTKIAGNAKVREIKEEFFVANLDTYGGNSGSAVFNTVTGEVEGILVRGETDFVFENGCRVSNVCENDECRGEDVTLISEVLDLVPELNLPPTPPPIEPIPDDEGEFVSNEILNIPDNSLSKVVSVIEDVPAISDTRDLKIGLSITHTYIGDLRVTLIAPDGSRVVLHDRMGWSADNIIGIYGEDLNSYQPIEMISPQEAGDWQLEVKDLAPFDTGTIDSWAIIIN